MVRYGIHDSNRLRVGTIIWAIVIFQNVVIIEIIFQNVVIIEIKNIFGPIGDGVQIANVFARKMTPRYGTDKGCDGTVRLIDCYLLLVLYR